MSFQSGFGSILYAQNSPPLKLRNQLLALACLLAFAGFGFVLFRTWVVQKPFGIILFLGDGLTPTNLTAARLYQNGADHRLTAESLPNVALLSNHASDFAVPDAPAAASAIATGVKVNNRSIATSPEGAELRSILDLARSSGRATAIVTNGSLTDAGCAAFYAHASSSDEVENIATQFFNAQIDVALGGGLENFTPEGKGGRRKDGRDLMLEFRQKGREVVRTKGELENAANFRASSLVGFFSNANFAFSDQTGTQQPSLADMVRRAIEMLQFNRGGYFLLVDAELISRASEQNDGEHVLVETLALDEALGTAMKYAGEKSLVIATGKHSIGGMSLNGYPLRQDHGVALIGTNPFGYPSITWATGPNGANRQPPLINSEAAASPPPPGKQPAAFYAPVAIQNAEDVIAVGTGPGSEALKGFQDNTVLFEIFKSKL